MKDIRGTSPITLPTIKNSLRAANIGGAILASSIGATIGSQEFLKILVRDVYTYAAIVAGFFFVFYMIVERSVNRKLRDEGHHLRISFFGNPLLRVVLLRLLLFFAGGWIVLTRYELGGVFSYVTLSVLVAFFVGGLFETCRLLTRSA